MAGSSHISSMFYSSPTEPGHVDKEQSVSTTDASRSKIKADSFYQASSDRRPVDPPPIVELHVYEGEENRDITLAYNASLFLCATLETARTIAPGRGSHAAQNGTPILTGTPVAGISILERPTAAGYFIFTDLSVRHEGHYRLAFTLFEELKDPKDQDAETPTSEHIGSQVYARCAVSSKPFEVYSAKKFPGLTESTILSRVVADQGCRVRIRRDIRLRRRDSKPGEKEWDDHPDQAVAEIENAEDVKKPAPVSPEVKAASAQAASNNNANSQALHAALNHHAASQPLGYQTNSGYSVPVNPQQSPHYAYLQQPQYGQAYPQHYQTPQYMQHQQQSYSPYQYAQYGFQQNGTAPVAPPQYNYLPHQQQMVQHQMPQQPNHQQLYEQQQQHPQAQMPPTLRHDSNGYNGAYGTEPQTYPGQQQVNAGHSPLDQVYNQQPQHHQQQQQPIMTTTASTAPLPQEKPLPPLKISNDPTYPLARPSDASAVASPLTATSSHTNTHTQFPPQPPALTAPRPPPPQFLTQPTEGSQGFGAKRSYASTFSTSHMNQPLRSGARPTAFEMLEGVGDGSSDEGLQDLESIKLSYRRADGTFQMVEPRTY